MGSLFPIRMLDAESFPRHICSQIGSGGDGFDLDRKGVFTGGVEADDGDPVITDSVKSQGAVLCIELESTDGSVVRGAGPDLDRTGTGQLQGHHPELFEGIQFDACTGVLEGRGSIGNDDLQGRGRGLDGKLGRDGVIRHGIRKERSPINATTRRIENQSIRKGRIDGVLIGKADVAFGEDRNQWIDDDSGFCDEKGQRVLRGVDRLR